MENDRIAHEEEYKTCTIELLYDDMSESPREWDNLGTIYYCSRNYILGDIRSDRETIDTICKSENYIWLPVYAYIHSGITMNTTGFSCKWDSGQCGIIAVKKDAVRKEYGWKKLTEKRINRIKGYLKDEIKTLDQFFTGDIYRLIITDKTGEEIENYWGFYGEDYAISEAKSIIDNYIKNSDFQLNLPVLPELIAENNLLFA